MKTQFNQRTKILSLYLAAVVVLIWITHQPTSPTPTMSSDAEVSLRGHLGFVFSDGMNFDSSATYAFLSDEAGNLTELYLNSLPDSFAYNGQEVIVAGRMIDADPTRLDDAPILAVHSLIPVQQSDSVQASVEGNERWVNIACRFGDMPDETPRPREFFQDIMANSEPGMDHYWRQTSTDLVNIEGSAAYGWFNLPQPKSYYERSARVNVGIALQLLMRDCVTLAAEQEGVNFKQFAGINMMLNDTFGCCAWGGRMSLNIEGETVPFRTTWLQPWAFNSLHVIAHEMGHGWGLPHSGGDRSHARYPYDSAWDIMSGGSMMIDQCRVGNNVFECFQVGTIGYHLEMLGWVPEERIITVKPGESRTITLEALTTIRTGKNPLVIKVQIGKTNQFYTVDARSFVDYDRNLPGEAIVLHQVIPGRSEPANVVDIDDNNNVNDEGAMWRPGETFSDAQAQIQIEVLAQEGTTFTVRITNGN